MARWGNHGKADTRSVNWDDVAATIEALERQYGGLVKLQLDREGCRGGSAGIWVRALAYRDWCDRLTNPIDVCTKLWPSNAHRTMAGMCFNLLHSLDHALDARNRASDGEMPF